MIIAELTAFHVRIPLRRPIRHASHTRTENDTLVVRCRLSTGEVGWGEGLPRPYVTGESIDDCLAILRQTDFRSQLDARLPALQTAVEVLKNLRLETDGAGRRDCFGNSVRAAVELSVLDAVARFEGVPLSRVTEVAGETADSAEPGPGAVQHGNHERQTAQAADAGTGIPAVWIPSLQVEGWSGRHRRYGRCS